MFIIIKCLEKEVIKKVYEKKEVVKKVLEEEVVKKVYEKKEVVKDQKKTVLKEKGLYFYLKKYL